MSLVILNKVGTLTRNHVDILENDKKENTFYYYHDLKKCLSALAAYIMHNNGFT